MKLIVKGQVFPKVWKIANSVKKLRDERKQVNLGASSVGISVYEVELPESSKMSGNFIHTPQGVRLYFFEGNQYGIDYLISEIDNDPITSKHFN